MATLTPNGVGISHDLKAQTCNCSYPIGLVIFLIFTIVALFFCICICCFDITKCTCFKGHSQPSTRKISIDPRFMDTTKFICDRKLSIDPRLLEYSQLLNCGSSSSSRSTDLIYSTDTSLVTTV